MNPVPTITSDDMLDAAIAEFEQLGRRHRQQGGATPAEHAWMLTYRDEIDRYEIAAGHEPDPPTTLAGVLAVEMFRRRLPEPALAELLAIPAPHLSALLRGKRKLSLDLARRLHQRLGLSAEVLLNLAA